MPARGESARLELQPPAVRLAPGPEELAEEPEAEEPEVALARLREAVRVPPESALGPETPPFPLR